jgi:hypothetical protein
VGNEAEASRCESSKGVAEWFRLCRVERSMLRPYRQDRYIFTVTVFTSV